MPKCFLIAIISYDEWVSGTIRLCYHENETQHHKCKSWSNAHKKQSFLTNDLATIVS